MNDLAACMSTQKRARTNIPAPMSAQERYLKEQKEHQELLNAWLDAAKYIGVAARREEDPGVAWYTHCREMGIDSLAGGLSNNPDREAFIQNIKDNRMGIDYWCMRWNDWARQVNALGIAEELQEIMDRAPVGYYFGHTLDF